MGRYIDVPTLPVETPEVFPQIAFELLDTVIPEVGTKMRVIGCNDRNPSAERQPQSPVPENIGRGDVKQCRGESG
jgi:hypothetical protein